jgi:hypothetical protein
MHVQNHLYPLTQGHSRDQPHSRCGGITNNLVGVLATFQLRVGDILPRLTVPNIRNYHIESIKGARMTSAFSPPSSRSTIETTFQAHPHIPGPSTHSTAYRYHVRLPPQGTACHTHRSCPTHTPSPSCSIAEVLSIPQSQA